MTAAEKHRESEALAANLKEQATQIQKVCAQLAAASQARGGLEISKSTPKMAYWAARVGSLNR